MKKKIREKMIEISYQEHLNRRLTLVLCTLVILTLIVMKINAEYSKTVALITWIIGTPTICLWDAFDTIKKFSKKQLEKNKMRYIILSDKELWFHILEIGLIVPMIWLCTEWNSLKISIAITLLAVSFLFVSKKISNIFKNRLIE